MHGPPAERLPARTRRPPRPRHQPSFLEEPRQRERDLPAMRPQPLHEPPDLIHPRHEHHPRPQRRLPPLTSPRTTTNTPNRRPRIARRRITPIATHHPHRRQRPPQRPLQRLHPLRQQPHPRHQLTMRPGFRTQEEEEEETTPPPTVTSPDHAREHPPENPPTSGPPTWVFSRVRSTFCSQVMKAWWSPGCSLGSAQAARMVFAGPWRCGREFSSGVLACDGGEALELVCVEVAFLSVV